MQRHITTAACVLLASWLAAAPSRAQSVPDAEVLFSSPIFGSANPGKIARVEPSGAIRIEPAMPTGVMAIANTEGHHLMLVRGDQPGSAGKLLRAQVTEIAEDHVEAQVGAKAAAALKAGQGVMLLRPFQKLFAFRPGTDQVRYTTTAQIRALPEVIEIVPAKPAAGASGGLVDAVQAARRAAQQSQSTNNIKQIMLAMHNYHSVSNFFPPAVVYGPDGKPWHSWRVLLLPYLEQAELYNQYNFLEPWDGPNNKKLIDRMPAVFRDPIYEDTKNPYTNYAVVVGKQTIFPPEGYRMPDLKPLAIKAGPGVVGLTRITDGTSNTVAVVPVSPERKIPWTKPEDIAMTGDAAPAMGKPDGIAAPYPARDGKGHLAPFGFADGSVRAVSDAITPIVLKAILTRDGGEVVSADAIPGGGGPAPRTTMPMLKLYKKGDTMEAVIE